MRIIKNDYGEKANVFWSDDFSNKISSAPTTYYGVFDGKVVRGIMYHYSREDSLGRWQQMEVPPYVAEMAARGDVSGVARSEWWMKLQDRLTPASAQSVRQAG